VADWGVVRLAA